VTVRVALVTLGCARNDVDSERLAGSLVGSGYEISEPERADVVLVNTCAFVEAARQESVDTLLSSQHAPGQAVIAVGCLAQRNGPELAAELPELAAVLGFDDYPHISERIAAVLRGERPAAPAPGDRRRLLPLAPVERAQAVVQQVPQRHRLATGPVASVTLASGCDRRCTFCAIPTYRGAFVSRPPAGVLAEVAALVAEGVREITLVSENTTSYGKDLGQPGLLESLLTSLAEVPGLARIRLAYLQPNELRGSLIAQMVSTAQVADYFDLSFQHASSTVLRRMKRFGSGDEFLSLISAIRTASPHAGIRTNVIVGFPGETEDDLAVLRDFLAAARLDAIGVFGYSDEEGTAAAELPDKHDPHEISARVQEVSAIADLVMAQRAADRIGMEVEVLIESRERAGLVGRAAHQGPEDSATFLDRVPTGPQPPIGSLVTARVRTADGVDLHARLTSGLSGR